MPDPVARASHTFGYENLFPWFELIHLVRQGHQIRVTHLKHAISADQELLECTDRQVCKIAEQHSTIAMRTAVPPYHMRVATYITKLTFFLKGLY